jgi:hypothetical protein
LKNELNELKKEEKALKIRGKKKQVVETTCGSHEKTSRDNCSKPGKLPLRKIYSPGGQYLTLK